MPNQVRSGFGKVWALTIPPARRCGLTGGLPVAILRPDQPAEGVMPNHPATIPLPVDAELLNAARAQGIDPSRAAEEGLREALRRARAEAWRRENAEAIASSNAWVEEHGLPLASNRMSCALCRVD